MLWTPNRITLLRVAVGFLAVCLFGKSPCLNLLAVALTVTAIALDALDGHIARKKRMATPEGAQIDILGDRMIENMYFTYFAAVGMVSLWLPMLFFARGAATIFCAVWRSRRAIPCGERTPCRKAGGLARSWLRVGVAGRMPR